MGVTAPKPCALCTYMSILELEGVGKPKLINFSVVAGSTSFTLYLNSIDYHYFVGMAVGFRLFNLR